MEDEEGSEVEVDAEDRDDNAGLEATLDDLMFAGELDSIDDADGVEGDDVVDWAPMPASPPPRPKRRTREPRAPEQPEEVEVEVRRPVWFFEKIERFNFGCSQRYKEPHNATANQQRFDAKLIRLVEAAVDIAKVWSPPSDRPFCWAVLKFFRFCKVSQIVNMMKESIYDCAQEVLGRDNLTGGVQDLLELPKPSWEPHPLSPLWSTHMDIVCGCWVADSHTHVALWLQWWPKSRQEQRSSSLISKPLRTERSY